MNSRDPPPANKFAKPLRMRIGTHSPITSEYCQNRSNLKMCLVFSGNWYNQRMPEHNDKFLFRFISICVSRLMYDYLPDKIIHQLFPHREFRKSCLSHVTRWIRRFLGPKHLQSIPSCVVSKVCNIFKIIFIQDFMLPRTAALLMSKPNPKNHGDIGNDFLYFALGTHGIIA